MHHSEVIDFQRCTTGGSFRRHCDAIEEPPKKGQAIGFVQWMLDDDNTGPIRWEDLWFLYEFYCEEQSLEMLGVNHWKRGLAELGIRKGNRNVNGPGEPRKRKMHYYIEASPKFEAATAGHSRATEISMASGGRHSLQVAACA